VSELRYVYAVADAKAGPAIAAAGLRGIDGSRVEPIVRDPLLAATSVVPAADFEEGPLNEHLQDIDWLAPRAAAHQDVNAALLRLADAIVPLSFGAIYRGTTGVKDLLGARATELRQRLAALAGKAEWIVSIEREDATAAASPALAALDDEIAAAAPGRAFLLSKRREEALRDERRTRDAVLVEETANVVSDAAVKVYREELIDDSAASAVARFSVLAARSGEDRLRDTVAALSVSDAARGYRVRLSGPWPAYRFGALPIEAATT
jgi:hypothetical protein